MTRAYRFIFNDIIRQSMRFIEWMNLRDSTFDIDLITCDMHVSRLQENYKILGKLKAVEFGNGGTLSSVFCLQCIIYNVPISVSTRLCVDMYRL